MCGLWTFINLLKKQDINLANLFLDFWNIKNRGPDNSQLQNYNNVWVGFHRLSIIDTSFKNNQPFIIQENERTIVFTCNGEIYNYKELIEKYNLPIKFNSDCMTIPELYLKFTRNNGDIYDFYDLFQDEIKGEFAFTLLEFDKLKNLKYVISGRDQIGIRPLYYHVVTPQSKNMIFSSEIKGTNHFGDDIEEFPPGNIKLFSFNGLNNVDVQTYTFKNVYDTISNYNIFESVLLSNINKAVINSVKRRLESDRPLAFLLSGGVDSSLVAAISAKLLGYPIRTYCCGMNEGTDLKYARLVAEHIGSNHTEVFFTPEEGLAAIEDVIWKTETWDTTTIRASVGQYIVSKYISTNTDAKVVLVGEGPDEVCSSYLFNWYAKNGESLHNTALEYVDKIHYYDGRRADRCISGWGMEGRVPLLDPEFIKAYWLVPPEWRMPSYKGIEKWWFRKAFDDTDILPQSVLWRKKEAFSDGVSCKEKSWFQIIQEYIEPLVSDHELNMAPIRFSYQTPKTKEAYYYRQIYCRMFGEFKQKVLPNYWQPKWDSNGNEIKEYIDPSARVLDIYKKDVVKYEDIDFSLKLSTVFK